MTVGTVIAALLAAAAFSHENTVSVGGAIFAGVASWLVAGGRSVAGRLGAAAIGALGFLACWIGFFLGVLAFGAPD